jgi:membrane protein
LRELRKVYPLDLMKEVYTRFMEDNVPGLAAQLAFYFLLSLFPFLIFSLTLLFTWVNPDQLIGLMTAYLPNQSLATIEDNLPEIKQGNGQLLSFGIFATIWSVSSGINAIMKAMNHAYNVPENRSFIKARTIAIGLTFAMLFVILVAILLPVFGHAIGEFVFSYFGFSSTFELTWDVIRWMLSTLVMFGVIMIIYYVAPNKRLFAKEIWIGAVFATVSWQLVSLGFSYYVSNFGNYTATYGSLGGVIVLMLWFFLSGMTIIVGGQVNATINHLRTR